MSRIYFNLRIIYQVILLWLCLRGSLCLYFNTSSSIEINPFNISQGFQLTFRTCDGGPLFKQDGTQQTYFELSVIAGNMNYTTGDFTKSSLVFKWKSPSKEQMVSIGTELDQNKPYDVVFAHGDTNSTLSVSIGNVKHSAVIPSSVLNIQSNGNMVLGKGFVGCIQFGDHFNIKGSRKNTSVSEGCPLDSHPGCSRNECPTGYKGYYCEVNIDDCAAQLCHHASKCVDGVNNYTCVCGIAWYGRHCDELKDKQLCDDNPCANGGVCTLISDNNNYTCACKTPYTGRNCTEILPDPCQSNPCQNGICKNISSTDYTCTCSTGFGGKNCDKNIDDCAKAYCGGGQCIDGIGNYSCDCTGTGYVGSSCKQDINECGRSPCHNGTCTNYAGGYKCTCLSGYKGKDCETDINECNSSPCKNGGNCTDLVADYTCHCPAKYSGKSCEFELHDCKVDKNFSACSPNPCINGNCSWKCSAYSASYNCSCHHGYRGVNCSEDIDECLGATFCAHNSTCKNTHGDFYCECPDGYVGKYCNISRDICHPNPCEHGTCYNISESSYNCSCDTGWQGVNCTIDIDECATKTGKCNDTQTDDCKNIIGGYQCVCKTGFSGQYCDDNINECESNPCQNGGVCKDKHGSYECFCGQPYTGKDCLEKFNYCGPADGSGICGNGVCVNDYNKYKYRCDCFRGWNGSHCERDIDECKYDYCKNNANCSNIPGNYSCTCQPGYTDHNCSTDINDCAPNPCKNNGTCIDQVNDYNCTCPSGYEGKSCDIDIDWCDVTRNKGSKPCGVNGVCLDGVLNYTCDCFGGFSGENCKIDFNDCTSNPCQNEAICLQKSNDTAVEMYFGKKQIYPRNQSSGYICMCQPGYNGTNCESDIDECQLYHPCNITGTLKCNDYINDYNCTCKPGFKGRNCSEDIDECASSPCLNDGICLNLEARFQCNCTTNYTGERCQIEADPCTLYMPCKNGATCTVTADYNITCSCAEGFAGTTCTNMTTLGFTGTSSMTVTVPLANFNISFGFQTIFPNGILVSESGKWIMLLKSGLLEFLWKGSLSFVIGTESFADSRWHTVNIARNEHNVFAEVTSDTCTGYCSNSTELPKALAAALSTGTRLMIGGVGASGLPNFTGSIRDFSVNDVKYYPGVSGVAVTDIVPDFQRQNVCAPDPCVNGRCIDQWSSYTCECYRNWTSTNCSEEVLWGTFGTISQLNNGYNSTSNQSHAKYSFSTAMQFKSLSFSIRTRSQASSIIRLYQNTSYYLSIETKDGALRLRRGGDVITMTSLPVADATVHYVRINRSTIHVDGSSRGVMVPALSISDVLIGELPDVGGMTSFQGCIRDVRLNGEQLLFFNQSQAKFNLVQENIALGCSSEDVCRKLSGVPPCKNNGNCTDLWNQYKCTCPRPYGGDNCELYGCRWMNFCPANATCMNVKDKPEFECLTEVTFNGTQSSAIFTNSTPLSNIQSLVLQFRTLQNTSSLFVSGHNNTLFEIVIKNGRLVVNYNLHENLTGAVNTDFFVSNGKWQQITVESTATKTNFSVSEMVIDLSGIRYLSSNNLVRNNSILNTAFTNLLSTSGVHLGSPMNSSRGHLIGCLRVVRIGEHILSFLQNLTVSIQPFNLAKSAFLNSRLSNVTTGCHSNIMCTSSVCGAGECTELWNDFSCECPDGYHGERCEYTPCSPSPCVHGDCTIVGGSYTCACDVNYAGKLCNESCANSPCKNGGKCVIEKGMLKCECTTEWTGEHCEDPRSRGDDDDDDNLPLIIGLSVAGGVLLLIIIVIICCCTRQTSSTFGTYSPRSEEKIGAHVEMNHIDVPPPEKLI